MRRLLTTAFALGALAVPLVAGPVLGGSAGAAPGRTTAAPAGPASRQTLIEAAAKEYGVPVPVLLAVAYNQSYWENHDGKPSTTAAYGIMGLTDVRGAQAAARSDARGETVAPGTAAPTPDLETAVTAARLTGLPLASVKSDDAANVRAGAALLAALARKTDGGRLPTAIPRWYGAVAGFTGTTDLLTARGYADAVFSTLRSGQRATTSDGQRVSLAAVPGVAAATGTTSGLGLVTPKATTTVRPDCPSGWSCRFVPAAYGQTDPNNKSAYGNYDIADRFNEGPRIDSIVVHDIEGTYTGGVEWFQSLSANASADYVVGSQGQVTQMVRNHNIAWHAGNWYLNMHSIGIEQQGYAINPAWFAPTLYRTTGRLIAYLAKKYGVRVDRAHILGHDNVPARSASSVASMHWDPGPFWDWGRLFREIGKPLGGSASADNPVYIITPGFGTNVQSVRDCEGAGSMVRGPTNFGWLRTGPDSSAPLYGDPGLHSSLTGGSTCANDWGDKAPSGIKVVVHEKRGQWLGFWYDGHEVWYWNGSKAGRSQPIGGQLVVLKPGEKSIPVYNVAYPAAAAYSRAGVPNHTMGALPYSFTMGQAYPLVGWTYGDYYYTSTVDGSAPGDRTEVKGATKFYRIQLGHRVAFVKASQVEVHTR
ncbi:MAG: N-acetylmuramoyl-L-alanine amidase [Mycobacteriales bacterium]